MNYSNIFDLHFLLKYNKITTLELSRYFIKKIQCNCSFNYFINLNNPRVLIDSLKSDILIKNNTANILTGIPFFCKDNFITKNNYTTVGSKFLKKFLCPYDSTLIKKLKNLGSINLAKTNMDEFSIGSSNYNNYYGVVKNSYYKYLSSGGSSGGSAVSVSLNKIPFAIGSDTGGSLRQPGLINNVFTLKPTYGRISRFGIVSYSSSLDQPGIISSNIINCAIVLNAISGLDLKDPNTLFFKKEDYTRYIGKSWLISSKYKNLSGLIIGISKSFYNLDLDYDVRSNFEYNLSQFEFLGAKLIYISFDFLKIIDSLYYITSSVELSSNLSRFDGIVYGYNKFLNLYNSVEKCRTYCFSDSIKDKILIGNYFLSSKIGRKYFLNSKKLRKFLLDDFQNKFKYCDVIITPILPILPWYIYNSKQSFFNKIFIDFYTTFVNFLGLPSISVPAGFINKYNNNIPLSFQVVGNYCKESRLIQICYEYHKVNNNFDSLWI